MSNIPTVVIKRLISAVPKFKKILAKAKERDVNESDTVTIITDMLEEFLALINTQKSLKSMLYKVRIATLL